jgi:hypothetical protein
MWCALYFALQLQPIAAAPKLNMDAAFTNAIHAAGFAVDNGKLAFTRGGRPLAVAVGRSTLAPLVDFNFGGATAVVRFVF